FDGPQGAVLLVLDELAVHDQLAHALDGDMVALKPLDREGARLAHLPFPFAASSTASTARLTVLRTAPIFMPPMPAAVMMPVVATPTAGSPVTAAATTPSAPETARVAASCATRWSSMSSIRFTCLLSFRWRPGRSPRAVRETSCRGSDRPSCRARRQGLRTGRRARRQGLRTGRRARRRHPGSTEARQSDTGAVPSSPDPGVLGQRCEDHRARRDPD